MYNQFEIPDRGGGVRHPWPPSEDVPHEYHDFSPTTSLAKALVHVTECIYTLCLLPTNHTPPPLSHPASYQPHPSLPLPPRSLPTAPGHVGVQKVSLVACCPNNGVGISQLPAPWVEVGVVAFKPRSFDGFQDG